MKSLEFLREAEEDLSSAIAYYEQQQPGLGLRFHAEVEVACTKISHSPLLWPERPGKYRRVNLHVFPYYIAYFIRDELVLVAAVAHGHRKPLYWKNRLAGT